MTLWASRLILFAWPIVILALASFRLDLMSFKVPLLAVALGVLLAAIGIVLLILGLLLGAFKGQATLSSGVAVIYFIAAFIIVAPAIQTIMVGASVPPIHDITTDPDDPPIFAHVPSIRKASDNSLELDAGVIDQQRKAYPDLAALILSQSKAEAMILVADTATAMGWEIVRRDEEQGQLEAVAQTMIFGFKDDIIVRIRETDGGTRVDVRSASRVGVSDLGANAARIKAYLAALQEAAK